MDESSLHTGVLLKGLPFSTTKKKIKEFFKNIAIHDDQITIIEFRNDKSTGLGFVRLTNDEVKRALLNDRNHMGNRYIEVYPSDESELYELLLKAREGKVDARQLNHMAGKDTKSGTWRDRSPIRRHLLTKCAYISGVPKGVTYKHIREFFRGRLIGHNCIHLLKEEGTGSFRGDGYVEFGSQEECFLGLRKNGGLLRSSEIQVVPCTREEMEEATENGGGKFFEEDLRDTLRSRRALKEEARARTPSPVRRRMKAYAATYGRQEQDGYDEQYREQLADPTHEAMVSSHHQHYHRQSRRDQFEEMAYAHEGHAHSREYHRKEVAASYPQYREEPRAVYREHRDPPLRHEDPPPREYHRGYVQPPHTAVPGDVGNGGNPPPPPPPQTQERRLVRLEGLPYETSVRHIMEFFREYHLQYEHVRIQCRDDGSPSGKAFVVFPTERHAREAVERHDKQYILGRYVEVILI